MKSVASPNLAEFITAVTRESSENFSEIVIFCDGCFLDNFSYCGENNRIHPLSVSEIHALHRVQIIANANHEEILAKIQHAWFSPRDNENTAKQRIVWAFFDLLSEFPGNARENASRVNLVLYMLNRLQSYSERNSTPVEVFLNLPAERPVGNFTELDMGISTESERSDNEDPGVYVCSDILKLASKWTSVAVLDNTFV